MIKVERIYSTPENDGFRILVDRLWPRGLSRAKEGDVVLLFGAKDEEHNNAVALKEYIDSRMKTRS